MKHIYVLILLFYFVSSEIFAQTLSLEVAKDTISMEEHIQVKYIIDKSCDGSELKFNDFIVVSGPNISKSVSYINGKRSAESSFTFILTAIKEGTFELPSDLCGARLAKPINIIAKANYESAISKDERIRKTRKMKKI